MELATKIQNRSARAAVLGAGYVGLPRAIWLAERGFTVFCHDMQAEKIASLRSGRSYLSTVGNEEVRRALAAGRLNPVDNLADLKNVDIFIICVPTPLDTEFPGGPRPDISYISRVSRQIGRALAPGNLVIMESTTYPGATEEIVLPLLREGHPDWQAGRDFYLAYSPERIDPGRPPATKNDPVPKVVGGYTTVCGRLTRQLFEDDTQPIVEVPGPREAEMVKLFENIFRIVNISMVNEVAELCRRMGVDIWEVTRAAASKPYGYMPFYPGPGLGGHCIPVDPFFLSWKARQYDFQTRFIELAGEINQAMPGKVLELCRQALGQKGHAPEDARILVLGVAYKANIDDIRESPVLRFIHLWEGEPGTWEYCDPFVPHLDWKGEVVAGLKWDRIDWSDFDLVVLMTDHDEFRRRALEICEKAPLIVDTRNIISFREDRFEKRIFRI